MNSDTLIIESCLKGNQQAFKELYGKHISYCYGICIRYSVKETEIKDLVQIIFSETFKSLEKFDRSKSQFKTWFTRICINQIITQRKKYLRSIQFDDVETNHVESILTSVNYAEDNISRDHILSLLEKMPENYRVVFNMFVFDGYSHDEISQLLDISSASSRVILTRARKWAKTKFEKYLIL